MHALPMAAPANIDVWLAFYSEIDDRSLLAKYRELLTEDERAQQLRFYFPDDRQRYLITRALVRTVLSKYLPPAPAEWRFTANPYGRPMIANTEFRDCGVCFNISHARGLIALAISSHREIGVDVENIAAREVSLDIADHFFAPTEVAALAGVQPDRQQDRFFEYWTFKESYIKARGMGLSIPLEQFSFHFVDERSVDLTVQPELGDDGSRWRFWQFRPTAEHLLALCAERRDATPPTLTLRKAVPLISDTELQLPLLKASARW